MNETFTKLLAQGQKVEDKFKDAMLAANWQIKKSTVKQDRTMHIDFFFKQSESGKEYGVDVKAMKKVNRYDANATATMTYLEIKDVYGRLGWAYGQAHYIAFDMGDHFLLVRTSNIRNWIAANVEKKYVSRAVDAHKKLYTRNMKDKITRINRDELDEISSAKLYYDGTITLV